MLGLWKWAAFFGFGYPWFMAAVTLIAGVSFVDDIRSLPDSMRLVAQLMANELKIGHVKVSLLYMGLQLAISLGFVFLVPDTVLAHWIYLIGALVVLAMAYVAFMKKYYHLHEEYLASLKK